MNPPRNRLQALDIPRPGASVVPIVVVRSKLLRHSLGDVGNDAVSVEFEDLRVDVEVSRVEEEGRVVERR